MPITEQLKADIQALEDAIAAVKREAFGAMNELECAAQTIIDDLLEEAYR